MAYEINGVEIKTPIDVPSGTVPVLQPNGRTAVWQAYNSNFSFPTGVTPTGTINGTNKVFTLPNAPPNTLFLFVNGLFQIQGVNYTLASTTITFTNAPQVGDTLIAF